MIFNEALNELVESIKSMVSNMINNAEFDKTYIGVITKSDINKMPYTYEVQINGTVKKIKSSLFFSNGDYVSVTFPRGREKDAILTPSKGGFCSIQSSATTISELINQVRYTSGCMGSVNLSKETSITKTWYNFIYIPHRNGGHGSDNRDYGTLLLFFMTSNNSTWYTVHLIGGNINAVQSHA